MTIKKKKIFLTTFSLAALLFLLRLFQVSAQVESEWDKATNKARKEYKNDKGFLERDYGDGIIMIYIPPGRFTMGSSDAANDEATHDVYLDGYWIGKSEVTLDQYKAFISETGHQALPPYVSKYSPGDNHPVVGVSWEDAVAYCKWLSGKVGINRVLRGGCWGSGAVFLRCADRYGAVPSFRGVIVGIRLCQDNK